MLFQINANQVQLPPLFRAPTWHFRGVASSLLGPHQTGARVTTLNLTPPTPPNDRPHEPPDPPRDDCASWRFQSGVASSIQGPHPRQLAFPPHPCLAADRVYLKPSRASRPAVRGQQPSWQCRGGTPLVSLNPGLAVDNDDGGGKGEGGNLLFRPIRRR